MSVFREVDPTHVTEARFLELKDGVPVDDHEVEPAPETFFSMRFTALGEITEPPTFRITIGVSSLKPDQVDTVFDVRAGKSDQDFLVEQQVRPEVQSLRVDYEWTGRPKPGAPAQSLAGTRTFKLSVPKNERARVVIPRAPRFVGRIVLPLETDKKRQWPFEHGTAFGLPTPPDDAVQVSTEVQLVPGRSLRLAWRLSDETERVVLKGGNWELDVTEAGVPAAEGPPPAGPGAQPPSSIPEGEDPSDWMTHTLDVSTFPPDAHGDYRLERHFRNHFLTTVTIERVAVWGVARFEVRHVWVVNQTFEEFERLPDKDRFAVRRAYRDGFRPIPTNDWIEGRLGSVEEIQTLIGRRGVNHPLATYAMGRAPLLRNASGQTLAPPHFAAQFRWSVVRRKGMVVRLDLHEQKTATFRSSQGGDDVPAETIPKYQRRPNRKVLFDLRRIHISEAPGQLELLTRRDDSALEEGDLVCDEGHTATAQAFDAELALVEGEDQEEPASAGMIRLFYNREQPVLKSFSLTEGSAQHGTSHSFASWPDVGFAWELGGEHGGCLLVLQIREESSGGSTPPFEDVVRVETGSKVDPDVPARYLLKRQGETQSEPQLLPTSGPVRDRLDGFSAPTKTTRYTATAELWAAGGIVAAKSVSVEIRAQAKPAVPVDSADRFRIGVWRDFDEVDHDGDSLFRVEDVDAKLHTRLDKKRQPAGGFPPEDIIDDVAPGSYVYAYRGEPGKAPGLPLEERIQFANSGKFRCVAEIAVDRFQQRYHVLKCTCAAEPDPSCPIHAQEPDVRGGDVATVGALTTNELPFRKEGASAGSTSLGEAYIYFFFVSRIRLVTTSIADLEGAGQLNFHNFEALTIDFVNRDVFLDDRIPAVDPIGVLLFKARRFRRWNTELQLLLRAKDVTDEELLSNTVGNSDVEVLGRELLLCRMLSEASGEHWRDRVSPSPEHYLETYAERLKVLHENAAFWVHELARWKYRSDIFAWTANTYTVHVEAAAAKANKSRTQTARLCAEPLGIALQWLHEAWQDLSSHPSGHGLVSRSIRFTDLHALRRQADTKNVGETINQGLTPGEELVKQVLDQWVLMTPTVAAVLVAVPVKGLPTPKLQLPKNLKEEIALVKDFKKYGEFAVKTSIDVAFMWSQIGGGKAKLHTAFRDAFRATTASTRIQELICDELDADIMRPEDGAFVEDTIRMLQITPNQTDKQIEEWFQANVSDSVANSLKNELDAAIAALNMFSAIAAFQQKFGEADAFDQYKAALKAVLATHGAIKGFGALLTNIKVNKAVSNLSKGFGFVLSGLELVNTAVDVHDKWAQDDWDAALLGTASTGLKTAMLAADIAVAVGALTSSTGVGLPVGAGLMLAGTVITFGLDLWAEYATDTQMETFARYCFLGHDHHETREAEWSSKGWYVGRINSKGIPSWARRPDPAASLDHQIGALWNIVAGFELWSDRLGELWIKTGFVLPESEFSIFLFHGEEKEDVDLHEITITLNETPVTLNAKSKGADGVDWTERELETKGASARWDTSIHPTSIFKGSWGIRVRLGASSAYQRCEVAFNLVKAGGEPRRIPASNKRVSITLPDLNSVLDTIQHEKSHKF